MSSFILRLNRAWFVSAVYNRSVKQVVTKSSIQPSVKTSTHARTITRTYAKGAATTVGGLALTRYGVVQLVHLVELWHFCNVYQVAHGKLLDLVRDLVQRFVKLHAICKGEKRGDRDIVSVMLLLYVHQGHAHLILEKHPQRDAGGGWRVKREDRKEEKKGNQMANPKRVARL